VNSTYIGETLRGGPENAGVSNCKGNEKRSPRAYRRLVNVREELARRELNDIVKSRGFRNDETAINQLQAAAEWLAASRINLNFDKISLITTNILIVALTYETHFEEGSSECINHRLVVNWKSISSDDHSS
jgi:hypothetical protein